MKLKIERNKITGGVNCRFEFNGNLLILNGKALRG